MPGERKRVHVSVRVSVREYTVWARGAALEGVSLPELCREAIRGHLRQLALLRLAGAERGDRVALHAVREGSG